MGTKGSTNRQRIVEAADRLFYVRGYNQTSFSDISDATGLPRGNFYYYFKTKEDILDAVVESRVDGFDQILAECTNAIADPRKRLLAFARVPLHHSDQVLQYGCPIGSLSTELCKSPAPDASPSRMTSVFDLLRHWIATQFSALGIAESRADQLAMDLLARLQGVVLIANIYKDAEFLKRASADIEDWLIALINREVAI
jgi:TetR/AcrR family transcriptional regulator, transcriptional repressor for nem operon